MAQQEITEAVAERDRLRAALQYARNLTGPDEIIDEALASTAPAPVDSVNQELIAVLQATVDELRDADPTRFSAIEYAQRLIDRLERV